MSNPVRIQHVKELRTPEAVRERCSELLQIGRNGDLPWFELNLAKLDIVSDLVITEMQHKYPNLEVPFHSRWRHFELAGRDLWKECANRSELEGLDRMVAAGDLAIVSVLLDAGAGPNWRYRDAESGLSTQLSTTSTGRLLLQFILSAELSRGNVQLNIEFDSLARIQPQIGHTNRHS